MADALIAMVQYTGFPLDRLIIQSFWPLALDRISGRMPTVPTVFLTSATLPSAPKGVGIPMLLNTLYSTLRGYEIVAPETTTSDLNATTVTVAHLLGRKVVPFTPDTEADVARMVAMGVDGVFTNYPDRVYNVLGL